MPDDRPAAYRTAPVATPPEMSPVTGPLVTLSGVSLSYPSPAGPVQVLAGIDLNIDPGEVLAVIGPSGSGKSSMIAIMAGLEPATSGVVCVDGVDLRRVSEAQRTRLRRTTLGIVFQSYHLVPAMSALENAALPLTLAGDRQASAKARTVLTAVGLGHRLDHRPSALSGGEQQRVAIARAFVAGPRLILADEPTGNLDQKTGLKIIETMFSLAQEIGAAMVMVTHDPMLAERCERTIRLDSGRLVP
ncbi:MAG: ABC transporter ATP-binding protein [Alphaproteobacteria bacterium]